uniref:Uncharacterized protein n=1 Tax=Daucus carota subsp. sativus TaxID=79200 RepID=A0A161XRE2_DAUCS
MAEDKDNMYQATNDFNMSTSDHVLRKATRTSPHTLSELSQNTLMTPVKGALNNVIYNNHNIIERSPSASIHKRSRRPSDFDLIKSNSADGLMVTQDKENITPGQSTKRVRFAEDDPVVNIGRNENLFKHGTVENVSRLNNVEFLSKKLEADNHFHNISFPNKMLMYLYADRVVNTKRQVRRKKPTFIGWSDSILLDRQMVDLTSEKFFYGKIALPLRHKDEDDESSYEDQTWNTDDQELSDDDEVQGFYDTNNCMIITPAKTNVETDVLNNYPPENIIQAGSSNFGGLVKQHDDSHFKGKNQASQSESQQDASQHIQIPTYVIDKLSENMDIYEDIQKKCMMYLSSAKGLFRKNQMVENLEAKFIKLIQDANQFIMDELTVQYNKDCEISNDGNAEEDSKKIGTSTDITVYTNPLDEDIFLSSQEWMLIDRLTAPENGSEIKNADIFNMESQSKTLATNTENLTEVDMVCT